MLLFVMLTAKVVLKHHSLEEVINDIDSINQAIWIEDSEGNVLSESNYTLTNDVIKTLRAYYSGLLVQIKSIKKASNFYDFEIGI